MRSRQELAIREGPGLGAGEGHEDVTVRGTLPLDQDELWLKCEYGHDHLAIRAGSERAANFGL